MPPQSLDHPLLQKRATCILQAQQLQRRADKSKRDLTDEETKQIDELLVQAKACEAQWEDEPLPLQSRQTLGPTGAGGAPTRTPISIIGRDGASVSDRLFGVKRANDGFGSWGEWLKTMDSGMFDQRLRAASNEGIDSEGGFLVPEIYQNMFIDAVIEQSILLSRCRKFPMTSSELKINGFDGNDHSSNLFGGFIAAWEEELASLSAQTPKHRRIAFKAKKLVLLGQCSNELLSDATSYEEMLGTAMIQATAWQVDYALFRGTGAGQPLGIINADSTISVSAVAGQTASTIWWANIVAMFARLHPASYNTAIWCCNPTCIPSLMTMDLHADTAGSGSLVGDPQYHPFRESDGRFFLLGREVLVTEKLPAVGTVGDIVLVDPQAYAVGMRQDVMIDKSAHAGFTTDSSYYRAKMRLDGMPLWAAAMTPNAGNTLSWCVTLAAR